MMTSLYRGVVASAGCLILLALAGCGDSGVAVVEGVVTLDGKPLPNAGVAFTLRSGGRPAIGRTDSSGAFRLRTVDGKDAVPVGDHVVTVTARQSEQNGPGAATDDDMGSLAGLGPGYRPPRSRWLIPPAYSKPDTSGLEFEVKAGVTNNAELKLTSQR